MLTAPQLRTIKTLLRYALDQIEETQNIVKSIDPRTSAETKQLCRLKNIQYGIRDELADVERGLTQAEKAHSAARGVPAK